MPYTSHKLARAKGRRMDQAAMGEKNGVSRILYLEDDSGQQRALATLLRLKGFAVDAVASVAEARHRVEEHHYAHIIADYHLPDGTAADLVSRAEIDLATLIVVTAAEVPSDLPPEVKVLEKPLRPGELLRILGPPRTGSY